MKDDDQADAGLSLTTPEPRRLRIYRAGGRRRFVLPLLGRLAHDRHMEADEPPPVPSTRPRPSLN